MTKFEWLIKDATEWKYLIGSGAVIPDPGGPVDRSALVAGVDKPNASNTGPYTMDIENFVDVYANAGAQNNEYTINTTTPQQYKIFWGTTKGVTGALAKECVFAGPDPDTFGPESGIAGAPTNKGCIQNFGTAPTKWQIEDCLIDPGLWLTDRAPGGARTSLNPHEFGIHGCNVKVYRTEIVNCGDGWNFIGPNGNDATAEFNQYTLLQQSWLHKGYYENDLRSVSDGQNHADGFQTNYGRNIDLIGNTIGGDRGVLGYNTWIGWAPSNGPGYNSGDDFAYSALMLTQEAIPASSDYGLITNYNIINNWLAGGTATVNIFPERGNYWAGVTFRGNRFMRRGTDWGKTLAANSPGWVPYQRNTGNGVYITDNNGVLATFEDNVYEDTGLPLPIPNF